MRSGSLLAAAVAVAVGAGALYAGPVFRAALVADLGWSNGLAAGAFAVGYLAAGATPVISGMVADRFGAGRLLVAGLFHKARVARESGNKEEAARLTDELARQVPDDASVQLLVASSLLKDRNDPAAARTAVEAIQVPADNARLVTQKGALTVEVLRASGQPDSADALLKELLAKYPDNRMLKQLSGGN